MPDRTRPIRKEICLNEQELSVVRHKMNQLGTRNFGAYARKMLIDGYIIKNRVGKAVLILMTHEVVLFLLLNLLHRCCADGGHGIEEIIKRTLQHPPHQGRCGAEERIIAKETAQHGRPLGEKSLDIAQLLRTGLAR